MELLQASFDDIDEMTATAQSWDTELIPLTNAAKGGFAGTIFQAVTEDCQYMYAGFPIGLTMFGGPPGGLITFNVQEPSRKHYWWRGHDLVSNLAWVFPVGGELHGISPPDFRVHTLSVTEERVAKIAEDWGMDLPGDAVRPETFPVSDEVLNDVLFRLSALRKTEALILQDQTETILRLLVPLWLQQGAGKVQRRPAMRSRYRALRKCLEIIEASDLQALTTQTLLSECHVSERTLQYAFRECFEMSPAAFLKSLRLARARSALRHSDPEQQTVGDIADRMGIWHLGQFAEDYRKRFGELPSETLAR